MVSLLDLPFSLKKHSVNASGAPLRRQWRRLRRDAMRRGLERDCGNTDADGARATRPRAW